MLHARGPPIDRAMPAETTVDSTQFPRIADAAGTTQVKQGVGLEGSSMSEVAAPGPVDDDDAAACGSGRVRIQPIDTRIRLHLNQTQVRVCVVVVLGGVVFVCLVRVLRAAPHVPKTRQS